MPQVKDSGDCDDDAPSDFDDSHCFVSESEFDKTHHDTQEKYDESYKETEQSVASEEQEEEEGQEKEEEANGEDEDTTNYEMNVDDSSESDPYTSAEEDKNDDDIQLEIDTEPRNQPEESVGNEKKKTDANSKKASDKSSFPFACTQCDKEYDCNRDLKNHVHRIHNPLISKVVFGKDFEKNDYKETCEKCKEVFRQPVKFRTHRPCNPLFTRLPGQVKGEIKVKCQFKECKITPGIGWYGEHLCKVHYKDTDFRYRCKHCVKTFWDENPVILHVANNHLTEEYVCHVEGCGQNFANATRLRQHKTIAHDPSFNPREDTSMQDIHYIKHKFKKKCTDCNRIFTHPSIFRIHDPCYQLVADDGSGLIYQCPDNLCQMRFTKSFNLATHVSQVHVKGSDFRYECKYCNLRALHNTKIIYHLNKKHGIRSEKDHAINVVKKNKNLSSTPVPLDPTLLLHRQRNHPGIKTPGKEQGTELKETLFTSKQIPEDILKNSKATVSAKKEKVERLTTNLTKPFSVSSITGKPEATASDHSVDSQDMLRKSQHKVGRSSERTSTITSERGVERFPANVTSSTQTQSRKLSTDSKKILVSQDSRTSAVGKPHLPPTKSFNSPDVVTLDSSSDDSSSCFPENLTERPTDLRLKRQESVSSVTKHINSNVNPSRVRSSDNTVLRQSQETVDFDQMVLEGSLITVQVTSQSIQAPTVIVTQSRSLPSSTTDHPTVASIPVEDGLGDVFKRLVNNDLTAKRVGETQPATSSNHNPFITKLIFYKKCKNCHKDFDDHLNYYVHDPCYGRFKATRRLKTTAPSYLLKCTLGCDFKPTSLKGLQEHIFRHFDYKPFVCLVCNDKFYSKEFGEQHYLSKHKLDSTSTATSARDDGLEVDQHFKSRGFLRNCNCCNRPFVNHLEFLVHDPCYGQYKQGKTTKDKLLYCLHKGCDFLCTSLVVLQEHFNEVHFRFPAFYCIHCPEKMFVNRKECQCHYNQFHRTKNNNVSSNSAPGLQSIDECNLFAQHDVDYRRMPAVDASSAAVEATRTQMLERSSDKTSSSSLELNKSTSRTRRSNSKERSVKRKRRRSRSPPSRRDSRQSSPRRYRSRSPERNCSFSKIVCCIKLPQDPCIKCNERHSFPTSNRTHHPCIRDTTKYIYDKETCTRKFRCEVCKKEFKILEDLGRHESMEHYRAEDVAFQCSLCLSMYLTQEEVFTHIRADHRDENPRNIEVLSLEEYTQRQLQRK